MGRCMKKCKRVGEIAVVELAEISGGVRTGELARSAKRIREVGDGELDVASTYVELRSTRRHVVIEETDSVSLMHGSVSCGPVTSEEKTNSAFETSPLRSSNTSSEVVEERPTIFDPERQTKSDQFETLTFSGGRERNSTSPSRAEESDDMESTAGSHWREANSLHRSTVHEMPSESEIEEFFAAAEKDLQKRFSEKYNFDIVKDRPLEGRYKWFPLKP